MCIRDRTSPETEGVVSDVIKNLFAKLPNYLVAVKTSDGRVAAGAQVVIYNQNKDQVATAVAKMCIRDRPVHAAHQAALCGGSHRWLRTCRGRAFADNVSVFQEEVSP